MARPRNFSREGVLERALPVFWKHGFADASLQELEKATGVNKSGLYAEFSGKEELFLASLSRFPTPGELADLMERSGFSDVAFESWTAGIVTLHCARAPLS